MKKIAFCTIVLLVQLLFNNTVYSQASAAPVCPGNQFYACGNPFVSTTSMKIFYQNVPLPGSSGQQMSMTGFPNPVGSLGVGPNLGFPAPNPTFWVMCNGTYWYYNNLGIWTNTGHTAGTPLALNVGGGGSRIYNIAGTAGQVYAYNGTGPGTLVTAIAGFNGSGIFDITADDADNFFILKTDGPQYLRVYNSAGVLQCSYNLAGIPTGTTPVNGAFAIVKNKVYTQAVGGVYVGQVIPGNSTITFTVITSSAANPFSTNISNAVDYANCSLPLPLGLIVPNGTLTCSSPFMQLEALIDPNNAFGVAQGPPTSTLNACTYTWSGPGISAGQSTPTITINQPGVYSYTTCTGFCPVYTTTASYTVTSQLTSLTPTLTIPACLSGTAALSVMPNVAGFTFLWSGPGIIAGQGTPTITINAPGSYSVTVTNGACAGSTSAIVQTPTIAINPNAPTICAGSSVVLNAVGNAISYNWAPSTGLSGVSGTIVTANPSSTQTYTLEGNFGTCTVSSIGTVSVITSPSISASASPPVICSGNSSTLSVNGSSNYEWLPPMDLNSTSGSSVIASPGSSTNYTVTGTNGICTASTSIYLQVIPTPDMTIIASDPKICAGTSVPITVTGAQTYSWSPPNGLSATTGSIVMASPLSTTNFTIIGFNQGGSVTCAGQTSYSMVVIPNTFAVASNSATICPGDKTRLSASGGNTILWLPNTGLNINNGNLVIASPTVSTNYTVNVSYNGYCNSYTTVLVNVSPLPSVNAGRDTTFNLDQAIFINATGSGTLAWIDGEGISCHDCPTSQIFPSRSGCFTAQATNIFGCKVTDQVCININEDFGIYVPNSFTPNGDRLNDIFLVYGYGVSELNMEIFDRWGQQIFNSNDFKIGWDGSFKGVECKYDVYQYKITYKSAHGKQNIKVGNVSLIR